MPIVKDVRVQRSLDNTGKNSILIYWNAYVPDEPDIAGFNIYRSVDLEEYEKLNSSPIVIDSYEDRMGTDILGVDYYYKVTYITDSTESSLDEAERKNIYSAGEQFQEVIQTLVHNVIGRTNYAFQLLGEDGKVYIKKFTGPRCPRCYGEIEGMHTDAKCEICFGTGRDGGYERLETRIAVTPFGQKFRETEFGFDQITGTKVYLSVYPKLHPFDIVCRQDNKRYIITDTQPCILKNMLIQQSADLIVLNLDHIAYKLP